MRINNMLLFAFLSILFSNAFSAETQIFQTIAIENDITQDGVKGLNLIYKFNFLPLEELNHNDTILSNADFKFTTTFSENGLPVKAAQGYKSIENDKDDAEFTTVLTSADITASKFDKTIKQFVPYAALKLSEGEHTLTVKSILSGKDGSGLFHKNIQEKQTKAFTKPPVRLFTMNIDYIEVNTMNASGQAWDYAFFKTDAPDVGVNILMGNTSVFKTNVNDTYMFAVGPNSKNITFAISENDKVTVVVQDIDVMFHDYVAKWNFTTDDKKLATIYTYNKSKGNIKSCNLTFRIDTFADK